MTAERQDEPILIDRVRDKNLSNTCPICVVTITPEPAAHVGILPGLYTPSMQIAKRCTSLPPPLALCVTGTWPLRELQSGRSTELTFSESGAFGQDPPGNPSQTSTDSGAFLPDDVSNNDDDDVLQ